MRLYALPDLGSMKVGELRKELESFGISTKSFFEKSELVEALLMARAKGKQPVDSATSEPNGASTTSDGSSAGVNGSSSSSGSSSGGGGASRAERLKQEMEKAKAMKVGALKKELQSLGVSTKSFFEKSEFVKAYAEAVVDGVTQKQGARGRGAGAQEEASDPTYRDVVMKKMDARDPTMLQGTVIDVTAGR
jgi:hypothetical protein